MVRSEINPGTVLVTGCAGFIGSHTAERLLESGHQVIGADDLSGGALANLGKCLKHPNFLFEMGDLSGEGHADRVIAMHRPDVVVHLAGLVDVRLAEEEPLLNQRLNIGMTRTIAHCAARHGVRRIVFSSSAAVYGNSTHDRSREESETRPIGNYGRAKLAGERVLLESSERMGIEVVALRYFNVYGLRQNPRSSYAGVLRVFLEDFRSGSPATVFGDGLQSRDFVSVEDIVVANLLAVGQSKAGSLVANVCTGRAHSLLEVLGILRRTFPLAPSHQFAPARKPEIRHSCGDPAAAESHLGFRPSISLEKGLLSMARNEPILGLQH